MKRTGMKAWAGILAIALTVAVTPVPGVQAAKKVALNKKQLKITVGKSKKLKLKNTKKKAKWKIVSGKKCVQLKAKKKTSVKIVARKEGSAKIQAVVGKKKYTCKVTVKAEKPLVTQTPVVTVTPTPTLTPTPSPTPPIESTAESTENPEDDLKPKDVRTLRAFITELKEAGATVSENILDSTQYEWDEDGYLSAIYWNGVDGVSISGKLVFPEFPELYILSVADTDISSLDVSVCRMLCEIDCSNCENLTDLNVSGCEKLEFLYCRGTALTTLDLSGCPNLDENSVEGSDSLEVTFWAPDEKEMQALEKMVTALIDNGASKEIAVWVWSKNEDEDGNEDADADEGENKDENAKWILNKDYYEWDASGHLTEIWWDGCNLSGEISLSDFTHLTCVYISGNALTSLDLSECNKLAELYCSSQMNEAGEKTLTSLILTGCSALESLECSECALTVLDLSDCIKLNIEDSDCFSYDYYGVDIIPPGGDSGGDDFDI